jgi:glycosyltransferase involved in cell wall biosynthesis
VRVLWLIKGLGPGGAEHLLVNHAAVRDQEGFDYEAAYLVPVKRHLVAPLEALGVRVTALDSAREWDPRWAWRLRRLLKDRPVDVIHGHSPYVAAVTRLLVRTLPRAARPALVYTEHNRWPRHRPSTRLANRVTFGLDDVQVAVSHDVRSTIPAARRDRVEVIVHGVDVDAVRRNRGHRDEVRRELGIDPDEIVIGIVANHRAEKAYDVWLEAASLVLRELDEVDRAAPGATPPRVRFVSVGQGPLEAEMRDRVRDRGLGDRVMLLGYRDDAVRVMSAFDVFTLTSRHEGLPVSLMDALVLGLPTVATNVGGIPEAVTDGIEGTLVGPDDPAALAAAYREIATDDALRSRQARAAADRGDAFDIGRAARVLEERYRDAAAARPRKRS